MRGVGGVELIEFLCRDDHDSCLGRLGDLLSTNLTGPLARSLPVETLVAALDLSELLDHRDQFELRI